MLVTCVEQTLLLGVVSSRETDPSTFNACGAKWKADYQITLITLLNF